MNAFTENRIFKNNEYRRTKGVVIGLEIVGDKNCKHLVKQKQIIREKYSSGKIIKTYSYTPILTDNEYIFFTDGFFNATEEEKIKFGLIFNDFDAYNMCLDAFNEAEAFYANHAN